VHLTIDKISTLRVAAGDVKDAVDPGISLGKLFPRKHAPRMPPPPAEEGRLSAAAALAVKHALQAARISVRAKPSCSSLCPFGFNDACGGL
jgi:hypothetical protein